MAQEPAQMSWWSSLKIKHMEHKFDPTNIEDIKAFLPEGAKKSLGQHFLTSRSVVKKMVEAAQIERGDIILEVGPGLGVLTQELVDSPAKEIIACEKDKKLSFKLKDNFDSKRLKIINEDALLLIPNLQVQSPFKVVSNLPYNIGSPILISLLSVCPTLPTMIVVMLQKEVAARLTARLGDSNRGLLTVFVELFGHTRIIEKLPKNLFYPAPQVDSAVLQISDITDPGLEPKFALRMLKFAFSGKRKMIKNSLFQTLKIDPKTAENIATQAGFSVEDRAEALSRDSWMKLITILQDLNQTNS
jgi:16S rRNA (adenine1518-N6/adenine1519-N6)-dimethyltransferase